MKHTDNGTHLRDRRPGRASLGTASKLSVKQRIMILSRIDRMKGARPTPIRVFFVILVLLLFIVVGNLYNIKKYHSVNSEPTPVTETQAQISFVGDICLGRYVEDYARARSYSELFANSRELWDNSDIIFANLECAILDDVTQYTPTEGKTITLPATTEALEAVCESGITALSIANNHSIDYGSKGLAYELSCLDAMEITYAGAGFNIDEAASAKIIERGDLKVGFLAFCDEPIEGLYSDKATVTTSNNTILFKQIRDLSDRTDLVVVYAHWGKENSIMLYDKQRETAHRLIESGADIVIGSHPHILQTAEIYQDGIIFYSLGNYIFDQGNRENRNTAMVQLNIDTVTGEGDFIIIPMRINDFSPMETDSDFYKNEIFRLLTDALDKDSCYIGADERLHIPMNFEVYTAQEAEPEPDTDSFRPIADY